MLRCLVTHELTPSAHCLRALPRIHSTLWALITAFDKRHAPIGKVARHFPKVLRRARACGAHRGGALAGKTSAGPSLRCPWGLVPIPLAWLRVSPSLRADVGFLDARLLPDAGECELISVQRRYDFLLTTSSLDFRSIKPALRDRVPYDIRLDQH